MAGEFDHVAWFCGVNFTGSTAESGASVLTNNSCVVDAVIAVPQLCFIFLSSLELICLGCYRCFTHYSSSSSSSSSSSFSSSTTSLPSFSLSSKFVIRLPGHTPRWILTMALLVLSLSRLAEGILTNHTFIVNELPQQPHLYIPGLLTLIASSLSIVYYTMMERWRVRHMLWLLLIFWVAFVLSMVVEILNIEQRGEATFDNAKFDISILQLWIVFLLLIVEFNLFVNWVLDCCTDRHSSYKLDDDTKKTDMNYLHDYSSLPSALFYHWMQWLFSLGFSKHIEPRDLGSIPDKHASQFNHDKFKRTFISEQERARKSGQDINLYRIYWNTYAMPLLTGGVLKLSADCLSLVGPLCISGIVLFITDALYTPQTPSGMIPKPHHVTIGEFFSNGFVLVGCIYVAALLRHTLDQTYFYICAVEGVHVKSALQSMVYEKSLRLSNFAMSSGMMSMGQVTNHMSVDAANVQLFFDRCNELWAVPIRITLTLVLLYFQLGPPAFIGASVLFLAIPIQLKIATLYSGFMKDILNKADKRLKASNEMLQGMKILKLYGWEKVLSGFIKTTRTQEMAGLFYLYVVSAFNFVVNSGSPILANLLAFATYTALTGKILTPDIAFSSLSLFNALLDPMFVFPSVIHLFVNAHVSTKRLNFFFSGPEIEGNAIHDATTMNNDANFDQIQGGCYTWDPQSTIPILSDISLDIPAGELTVIIGTVGSGKSSLLQAIMGEMTTLGGTTIIKKGSTIAYGPQKAWLMNASLKENITFGSAIDPMRYQKVIDACALAPDIAMLPGGDHTEIGEKGINLSGGQKQRVSVARTMYSDKDIVILDDPLSALDMHVGAHLFENGFLKILKKQRRTVLLVTHQLQYLPEAEKIIVMKNGRVHLQGNPEEIAEADPSLCADWQNAVQVFSESEAELSCGEQSEAVIEERAALRRQISKISATHSRRESDGSDTAKGKLIVKEDQEQGSVSYKVYLYYCKSMGYVLSLTMALTVGMRAAFQIATSFWLSIWSEDSITANSTAEVLEDTNYYVAIYSLLSAGNLLARVISVMAINVGCYLAARNMHISMLDNIISIPMRFFDTTPTGRILNRFSTDTQYVDQRLMQTIRAILNVTAQVMSSFIVIIAVSFYFVIFMAPIAVGFGFLLAYYIMTSRELQRCESVTRSPIFAHFSETLGGLSTIRAFHEEKRFFQTALDRILENNTVFLYLVTAQRWVNIRLDMLGAHVVLLASLASLLGAFYLGLDASSVGLAITYSLDISLFMNWVVRAAADVELQMNAVERVQYYTDIPTEDYSGVDPPDSWPQHGEIQLHDVNVRYSEELAPVLRGITLSIPPCEKLGICGRTGSGKSSLTLALFRIIDTFKGRVVIDGIDIASIPLLTLRQRLSIIPQDAFLFTGSIRLNLDPTSVKLDADLWKALEIAQLKDVVQGLDTGLDYEVTEGGDNFSAGQRQLFCLARAFLRNSKIVVMDEATASIDQETDAIIQEVVSEVFKDRTVLTIAHRVGTILESDSILTLSDGRVVEFDSPASLLEQEDSTFASLVKAGK